MSQDLLKKEKILSDNTGERSRAEAQFKKTQKRFMRGRGNNSPVRLVRAPGQPHDHGCVHQCARVAHGRTRMIVFPLIRSVGLFSGASGF